MEILIQDSGIGIPKEQQSTIFNRFTQVDSQYSRRYGGVGLGLSICKQLVEVMDGKIGVISEYGKGATFWFTLCFKREEDIKQKLADQVIEKDQLTDQDLPIKCHILLVEDNRLNQQVTKAMLNPLGCQVSIADNGIKALKLFEENDYDIIFMDIGLPDMDGLEVTRKIRGRGRKGECPPIIALTAHVLAEDRKKCLDAGINDVLTKPIMQNHLMHVLKHWVVDKAKN